MEQSKVKYPKKGGAKKVAEEFEKNRKKAPSDELVKIISEYGDEPEVQTPKKDRAAKSPEV